MKRFIAITAKVSPQASQHDLVLKIRVLAMLVRVTCGTERNQILLGIVSGLTAVLSMVDFKVQPCAASLASPAVPLQDESTKLLVRFGIQPQTRTFWSDRTHEARPFNCSRNACFCSPGRNFKNC